MLDTNPNNRQNRILLGEHHSPVFNRLVARAIDCLLIVAIFFIGQAIWRPAGILFAATFAAIQDGFGSGQSIGKRIMGLRVIDDATGISCSFRNSFLRNFPFALAVIFLAVKLLWVFFILLILPILGLEVYLLFSLTTGVRLGDVLANTLVVEYIDDAFDMSESKLL